MVPDAVEDVTRWNFVLRERPSWRQCGNFMKGWQLSRCTISLLPFDPYHPKETKASPAQTRKHCNVVSNSLKLEANHMPIARWLCKQGVMYVRQGCHSAIKGVS